jgi:aspartate racemase
MIAYARVPEERSVRTIGLVGGMSWESSATYYKLINEGVKARLGGLHSARSVLFSVDFSDVERLQHAARWEEAGELVAEAAQGVERAGAECVVLCTNTMHKVAEAVEGRVRIPFLHIADATAAKIRNAGFAKVGLLGTRFTMEEQFYKGRLEQRHQLEVMVPDERDRESVHRVIYDELCLGEIRPASRKRFVEIMARLVESGAQAIVLGCTEIGLLVSAEDGPVPLFDTTRIHAAAAVDFALAQ